MPPRGLPVLVHTEQHPPALEIREGDEIVGKRTWADGIYSALRGEGERLCVLVVIGVNARGEKHFVAIEDGVRESTQSGREVVLAMKQRGFTRPAKLAVGDGALGFWAALSEVFPSTRTQRCWMHKTGNVLNSLPKFGQAKAKQGLHEIWMAETRRRPSAPSTTGSSGTTTSTPRPPPAWLATFYDFPGAHWTHLRTTNVIESAFATIRHRSSRAKGCVTRQTMLSMIDKMGRCAEQSWRRLRGFRHLREGHRGSPVQRRHRGHRGQQSRRMNNPSYTRFDNSSIQPG